MITADLLFFKYLSIYLLLKAALFVFSVINDGLFLVILKLFKEKLLNWKSSAGVKVWKKDTIREKGLCVCVKKQKLQERLK